MTVNQAITYADAMKPNQFDEATKIGWLSKLDGMLFAEVFKTHEGCEKESFSSYSEDDKNEALLVPAPYDQDIYNFYLQAQMDAENGEMNKYNQSITLYNNAVKLFMDWYNRTHMPLPAKTAFRY